jgi:hypothetical protein
MPHTSWGLLKAIRSHQITNPSVDTTLKTGRPNACNLCHLDQSLGWTMKHLANWYGTSEVKLTDEQQSTSAAVLWALRGEAGQRALMAWSMGWQPAQQASGSQWMAPFLAQLLDDPYAAVRYRAGRGLRQIPGFEDFSYDYVAPAAERARARSRALDLWNRISKDSPGRAGPHILMNSSGGLLKERFEELLRQRDDRSVFLVE